MKQILGEKLEMKYLRYLGIVVFALFRKVFGLVWFYVALPFRRWARNVVYNYTLQNELYLKRLLERPISELGQHEYLGKSFYGWKIAPYHDTNHGGYIEYKRVNKLTYLFAFWVIWGWVDDDSNHDTMDKGFTENVVRGEHFGFLPQWLRGYCADIKWKAHGNTFDTGDALDSEFHWLASTLWLVRNTAYNFKYSLHECRPEDKGHFYIRFPKLKWHFGYIPKQGSHYGRMVYFNEYWEKG